MIEFVIRPWKKYYNVLFAFSVAPDFAFIQFGRRVIHFWDRNGVNWLPAWLLRLLKKKEEEDDTLY